MMLTLTIAEQPDGQVALDIKGVGVCSPREAPVLASILNALTYAVTTAPGFKVLEHEIRDTSLPLGKPSKG